MKLNKLFSLLLALKLSSAQGKIGFMLNLQRQWLFEIKKEHYCCKFREREREREEIEKKM